MFSQSNGFTDTQFRNEVLSRLSKYEWKERTQKYQQDF